ncbi:TrlF family AAA-like ATPase [Glutamicibacter sp. PS]|uniref:TrlF family AAA-like ATPase n=1 Tax=Glutamicibacter sp. PS TaxID=3075634 RepID=UPI00283B4C6C|nr:AAA family ATPase [Glutamicibacter sp. PS]MDR4533396.1 AAA family ATPase [Glutamicibacter sp. PS]
MARSDAERGRGTAWRIWDLHVHTPASIVQEYGADTVETWERFISELEALPEDVSVIGINDYWFLDGYERVLNAKRSGRLQNLEAIFPVIEMRLDHFGGTDGNLSRVNLHVVFDPDLDAEMIRAQFIGALQPKVILAPNHAGIAWQGVITRESLSDLGRRIKETVPGEQLSHYGPDLKEGFNNINVRLDDVQAVLDGPYFKGRALIGIGKTEWRDIKWNHQSIASKKNVINSASFVFTAYPDTTRWSEDVKELRSSNVTHKILDCSDAHYFSGSDQHMRLGACQTWMNTTPTLAGLAYAIEEFDRRVYVGLEPPALARVRRNPERFIERIRVASENEGHDLFDHDLPLNSGFVAVVGNKGQGKSALLDCIALGGNSSRNNEFAFLSTSRFLSVPNQKSAREYTTELVWATGTSRKVQLTQAHDKAAPVSVEYLPQMFVERVCNQDPDTDDTDEFERELRTILFTHIPESEKAGEKTFDALLSQKTQSLRDDIFRRRDELHEVVRQYVAATAFRSENQATEVQSRLVLKKAEVDAAKEAVDAAKAALAEIDSESKADGELAALRQRSEEIEKVRSSLLERRGFNEQQQAQARQQLASMETIAHRAEAIRADVTELNNEAEAILGGEGDPYLSLTINDPRYASWQSTAEAIIRSLSAEREALDREIAAQDQARRESTDALAAADSARERARQRVLQSEERMAALIGDENDDESHAGLTALLQRISDTPAKVSALRDQIIERSKYIYEALEAQLRAVEGLYAPASEFIARSEVVKNAGLEFNAELRLLPTWRSVSAGLDGRRNGDFTDWLTELPQRLEDTSWDQLAKQLSEAMHRLERERGEVDGELRNPSNALRSATTLDSFLMSMLDLTWLEVRFGLTGDGQPLSQLSPGQRGLVLALFYLVVDRRTTPLLLDQPEENLDNETIASKLVPAIHEAAGRRQTVVVTHNANLAVVGDADQIIHCQMLERRFTVSSGSIAELDVAKFALDILEGTKPAFDNRRHKYEAFPSLA